MNQTKSKSFFLTILAIVPLIFMSCYLPKAVAMRDVFDHYGYTKARQKEALEYLCQEAGVLAPGQSLIDRFPARKEPGDLLKDSLEFIELTQKQFWLRKGTEERWEAKPKSWMLEKRPKALDALRVLGVVEEISPKNQHPDVICVLGSPLKIMDERIGYIANLINHKKVSAQHLVLLAGERYCTIGVDGTKEELLKIAKSFGLNDLSSLTETHLIEEAYKNSSIYKKFETSIIDTPRGSLPRPTTETTTLQFIKWLKLHPQYKSVLFISNQPYVNYQQAVIAEVFKAQRCPINFEVAGSKAQEPLNTQMLVESLGSYLWAKTPQVVREMNIKSQDQEIIKQFKNLYRNNPVIYQNLEY